MRLDPNKGETYWSRGWAVVEGAFEGSEIEPIIRTATELCEREIAEAESSYREALVSAHRVLIFAKYPSTTDVTG